MLTVWGRGAEQGKCQEGNLPDVRVVDVKRQTDHSQDNAQAGQNRDGDEEFLGHEAKCLDDQGLVSRGSPSCMAWGVRGVWSGGGGPSA